MIRIRGALGPVLIVLALLCAGAEAAEPRRVLIIHTFGRDFAPFNILGPALRTDLAQLLGQPVAFLEISLDAERAGPPEDERAIVEYLSLRARGAPPELVIANGAPALRFYLRHRAALFPDRPLLVTGIDARMLKGITLGPNDRAVTADLDFSGVAQTILALRPATTTVALVLGVSPLEQFWAKEVQREFELGGRLRVLPPGNLSLEQMRQRVAALPPDSAVFYQMFSVGADGVQHEHELALAAIRASSSAPVFGLFANQLGKGTVGGSLFDLREAGRITAELAVSMLRGEGGENRVVNKQTPAFDWRELERWGIPESRLPQGAEVRFRPPSLWEEHRLLILVGIGIVLFQSALIAGLLFQRARRRTAEEKAVGLGGRLITAQEDERKRLARDLHDDVSQQLAGLSIAFSRLKHRMADSQAAEDLQTDVRTLHERTTALAQNVRYLSHDLHPTVLRHVGLVAALKSHCTEVERSHSTPLSFSTEGDIGSVAPGAALCLYRIAQEALRNVVTHAGASRTDVHLLRQRDQVELTVTDNGNGFDAATAKRSDGLGLVSIAERARLAGGSASITSEQGKGTCVRVRIPAGVAAKSDSGTA